MERNLDHVNERPGRRWPGSQRFDAGSDSAQSRWQLSAQAEAPTATEEAASHVRASSEEAAAQFEVLVDTEYQRVR